MPGLLTRNPGKKGKGLPYGAVESLDEYPVIPYSGNHPFMESRRNFSNLPAETIGGSHDFYDFLPAKFRHSPVDHILGNNAGNRGDNTDDGGVKNGL